MRTALVAAALAATASAASPELKLDAPAPATLCVDTSDGVLPFCLGVCRTTGAPYAALVNATTNPAFQWLLVPALNGWQEGFSAQNVATQQYLTIGNATSGAAGQVAAMALSANPNVYDASWIPYGALNGNTLLALSLQSLSTNVGYAGRWVEVQAGAGAPACGSPSESGALWLADGSVPAYSTFTLAYL